MIAVVGITHTLEGTLQRHCCHGERTTLGGRIALIHILYALSLVACARSVEVYLQVLHRLECKLGLQILSTACCGRSSYRVAHQ